MQRTLSLSAHGNSVSCHAELVSASIKQKIPKQVRNDIRNKYAKSAFSLIEIMIALIVLSVLVSAFAPVITKKLVETNIHKALGLSSSSSRYQGRIFTYSELKDNCRYDASKNQNVCDFKVPEGITKVNMVMVSGGGGGAGASDFRKLKKRVYAGPVFKRTLKSGNQYKCDTANNNIYGATCDSIQKEVKIVDEMKNVVIKYITGGGGGGAPGTVSASSNAKTPSVYNCNQIGAQYMKFTWSSATHHLCMAVISESDGKSSQFFDNPSDAAYVSCKQYSTDGTTPGDWNLVSSTIVADGVTKSFNPQKAENDASATYANALNGWTCKDTSTEASSLAYDKADKKAQAVYDTAQVDADIADCATGELKKVADDKDEYGNQYYKSEGWCSARYSEWFPSGSSYYLSDAGYAAVAGTVTTTDDWGDKTVETGYKQNSGGYIYYFSYEPEENDVEKTCNDGYSTVYYYQTGYKHNKIANKFQAYYMNNYGLISNHVIYEAYSGCTLGFSTDSSNNQKRIDTAQCANPLTYCYLESIKSASGYYGGGAGATAPYIEDKMIPDNIIKANKGKYISLKPGYSGYGGVFASGSKKAYNDYMEIEKNPTDWKSDLDYSDPNASYATSVSDGYSGGSSKVEIKDGNNVKWGLSVPGGEGGKVAGTKTKTQGKGGSSAGRTACYINNNGKGYRRTVCTDPGKAGEDPGIAETTKGLTMQITVAEGGAPNEARSISDGGFGRCSYLYGTYIGGVNYNERTTDSKNVVTDKYVYGNSYFVPAYFYNGYQSYGSQYMFKPHCTYDEEEGYFCGTYKYDSTKPFWSSYNITTNAQCSLKKNPDTEKNEYYCYPMVPKYLGFSSSTYSKNFDFGCPYLGAGGAGGSGAYVNLTLDTSGQSLKGNKGYYASDGQAGMPGGIILEYDLIYQLAGGGGGGGGAFAKVENIDVEGGKTYKIRIGGGGLGGDPGYSGQDGGDTVVEIGSNKYTITGGKGGRAGVRGYENTNSTPSSPSIARASHGTGGAPGKVLFSASEFKNGSEGGVGGTVPATTNKGVGSYGGHGGASGLGSQGGCGGLFLDTSICRNTSVNGASTEFAFLNNLLGTTNYGSAGSGGGGGGWNNSKSWYDLPGLGGDGQEGYVYIWWDTGTDSENGENGENQSTT